MLRVRGFRLGGHEQEGVLQAGRRELAGFEGRQDLAGIRRLVDGRVLAFNIEDQHAEAVGRQLLDEPGHAGGLAGAGGADDEGVSGNVVLLVAAQADVQIGMADGLAEAQVAVALEGGAGLLRVEQLDRAVGPWPGQGREHGIALDLAEDRQLDPAVVGRREHRAFDLGGDQQRRLRGQAVRRGVGAARHLGQVQLAILPAIDVNQGLGTPLAKALEREDDHDRAVVAGGRVEQGPAIAVVGAERVPIAGSQRFQGEGGSGRQFFHLKRRSNVVHDPESSVVADLRVKSPPAPARA